MTEIGRMGFSQFTELAQTVGATGPQGIPGDDGTSGSDGATGATGPAGEDGAGGSGGGSDSTAISLHEEFLGSLDFANGAWVGGVLGFTASKSGTSAGFGSSGGTIGANYADNAIGVVQLQSGSTSSGLATLNAGAFEVPFRVGEFTFEARINIPVLSTGTQRFQVRCGIYSGTSASTPGNGIWFSYKDDVNSGNWTANYRVAGGTVRTFNTGIAATTSWTKLKFTIVQEYPFVLFDESFPDRVGPAIRFFVNDVQATGDNDGGTSNNDGTFYGDGWDFPTVDWNDDSSNGNKGGPAYSLNKTVGGTERTTKIDYMHLECEFTTPR